MKQQLRRVLDTKIHFKKMEELYELLNKLEPCGQLST